MPAESLLPLFAYFVIGFGLRAAGVLQKESADVLFRLVFNVTLPALAFLSISQSSLDRSSALLPVAALSVNLACLGFAYLLSRAAKFARQDTGSLLLGSAICNMVFIFPFVLAALGPLALAEAVLFDLGNAIFVATVATSIAIKYGETQALQFRHRLFRLFKTPIFIALGLAIALKLGEQRVPIFVSEILSPLAAATIPLTIVALGLSFRLSGLRGLVPFTAILLRMPLGLAVGAAIVHLFGIEGDTAIVVLVSAAAPIGVSAVTLASVAELNAEQLAAATSLSILLGMFTTTVFLWIAG
jgi:predicted permease